jgi:hypothetical protein
MLIILCFFKHDIESNAKIYINEKIIKECKYNETLYKLEELTSLPLSSFSVLLNSTIVVWSSVIHPEIFQTILELPKFEKTTIYPIYLVNNSYKVIKFLDHFKYLRIINYEKNMLLCENFNNYFSSDETGSYTIHKLSYVEIKSEQYREIKEKKEKIFTELFTNGKYGRVNLLKCGDNWDIGEPKYYTSKTGKNFMLTNGANPELQSGGSGTNGAITQISKDNRFFVDGNVLLDQIFSPNVGTKILREIKQTMHFYDTTFDRCSVFKTKNVKRKVTEDKTIIGVYHIGGIDWNSTDKSRRPRTLPLVTKYYLSILMDFFTDPNSDTLSLVDVPGNIYNGSGIAEIGMFIALCTPQLYDLTIPKDKYIYVSDTVFTNISKTEIVYLNFTPLTLDPTNVTFIDVSTSNSLGGGYYNKYIKYKSKYLELKQKLK